MKLMISVPTLPHGSVPWQMARWMQQIVTEVPKLGWDVRQDFVIGQKGVCSVRNQQVHHFLSTDCDVLLTVDDDAIPDGPGLALLLEAIKRDDVDIVGGWSLMSTGSTEGLPNIFTPHDEKAGGCFLDAKLAHRAPGLHEITGGALGSHCIMVKRRVLEAFKERRLVYFEDEFRKDDPEDSKFGTRRLGHDVRFFQTAADLGFRTWCDNRVLWGHVKAVDLRDWYRAMGRLYDEIASYIPIAQMLRESWGNEDFTAGPVYLMRMAYEAAELPEDQICVECGSGLSSMLLSRILPPERLIVLESEREWFDLLKPQMNGSLRHAPLESKGEYDWYRLPELDARKVGLVVCDGPRWDTRGGRYGAMPQLTPHLVDDFTVMLDDVQRDDDRAVAVRWAEDYGLKCHFLDDNGGKGFAVLSSEKL